MPIWRSTDRQSITTGFDMMVACMLDHFLAPIAGRRCNAAYYSPCAAPIRLHFSFLALALVRCT